MLVRCQLFISIPKLDKQLIELPWTPFVCVSAMWESEVNGKRKSLVLEPGHRVFMQLMC